MMRRARLILDNLPDPDDALRRLSNVLEVPVTCRKRACRRDRRCLGGYGPPCFFERRKQFADAVLEGLHERRAFWDEQRARIEAVMRG
jgi:hypothetical protein